MNVPDSVVIEEARARYIAANEARATIKGLAPMTSDEQRMIESLVYVPKVGNGGDVRVIEQLRQAARHAGVPRITEGQAACARRLVLKYQLRIAPVVVALAESSESGRSALPGSLQR